jgi:uncharacterized protein (TIGR03067 family)
MDGPAGLEGVWEVVKAELSGEDMPAFIAGKIEIELTRGTYDVRFGGESSDRGTYAVGGTESAREIFLTGVEGSNAGRTIPAIYQLMRDRLRVCYGLDGVIPGSFATTSTEKRYLALYRRKTRA